MALTTNTNNVSTDANGRTIFSGITSGINAKSIVDNIIKAKQIQIDKISDTITKSTEKVTALDGLKTKTAALQSAMSLLYGKVTFDKSGSIFDRKTLSATTAKRAVGAFETTNGALSSAADIVNITATNVAAKGVHEIEVMDLARAHVRRTVFASRGALNLSGNLTIASAAILETAKTAGAEIAASLADKINRDPILSKRVTASVSATDLVVTANGVNDAVPFTLADATGGTSATAPTATIAATAGAAQVLSWDFAALAAHAAKRPMVSAGTATINGVANVATIDVDFSQVQASDGQNYSLRLGDASGTTLRVTAATGETPTTIMTAFKAKFDALFGNTSSTASSGTTLQIAQSALGAGASDLHTLGEWRCGLTTTVAVSASDTIADIRGRINATNEGETASGLVASQISVSASEQQLLFSTDTPHRFLSVSGLGLSTTTIENPSESRVNFNGAIVRRSSNVLDDVVTGLTVKLIQAETQTRVRLDVGIDNGAISTTVSGFVAAYNEAMRFVNEQTKIDPATGSYADTAILANSRTLREFKSFLEGMRSFTTTDADGLLSLADIGVSSIPATATSDPLARSTLQIDETRLAEMLMTKPEKVRRLFELRFTTSATNLSLLTFNEGSRDVNDSFTLSFDASGVPALRNAAGAALAVERNGTTYRVTSGSVTGLTFLYTGGTSASDTASFSVMSGLGTQLYFVSDQYSRPETGRAAQEIGELGDLNKKRQTRIDALRERLERQREQLMARFQRMESNLGRLASLRSSIEEFTKAGQKSN